MTSLFWILVLLLAYSYVGYGLLLITLAALNRSATIEATAPSLGVTVLIAARNEEGYIGRKLDNLLQQDTAPHKLEIVVVSDGSTDGTHSEVQTHADQGVRLLKTDGHEGKYAALNLGMAQIESDIVVFTDANSWFQPGALMNLFRHFGDPSVGCVCGQIGVPKQRRGWTARAEAAYWRYDHALKKAESRLGGAVSAQGSLYAVRRELLAPIPPAVADDLNNSLRVVLLGQRIVFEPNAVTEEHITEDAKGEFRRRIRSTERGWRGLMLYARLLNPLRFGFYSFKLISHKLVRRLTPFMWLALALVTIPIVGSAPIYTIAAIGQILLYGIAFSAWIARPLTRLPGMPMVLFFVAGHIAMAYGVINALRGHHSTNWTPVRESSSDSLGD